MQISLLSFLHRLTKLPNRIYSGDFYKINIILSLLFSIPYVYKISKTHFYWRFCHPTFSFIVGMLFCPHYLLFFEWVGVFISFPIDLGFLFFFPGICRNMDLASYWRFWWVGLSYFLSEGESLRILSPFRGIIASLNT